MAPLGENFRGGKESICCPLCSTHLDNQEMFFKCPEVKKKINAECGMEKIYIENVGVETANIVSRMLKAREEMVEEKKKETKKKQLIKSYQKDGCPEARNKVNVQEEACGIAKTATRMDVQEKIKDEKVGEKTLPEDLEEKPP